jgi:hypothetical protein
MCGTRRANAIIVQKTDGARTVCGGACRVDDVAGTYSVAAISKNGGCCTVPIGLRVFARA